MGKWTVSICAALLCGGFTLDASSAPEPVACVAVKSSAPYQAVGYGHLASVQNNCEKSVRCELWTDVDPQPHHVVDLEPKGSTTVAFRRDSPSREFRVQVSCQFR